MTSIFQTLFRNPPPRKLTAQEAFAGILYAACSCDGDVADIEIQSLIPCLARMKLFDGYDGVKCDTLINKARKMIEISGIDQYLGQCVAALPEHLCQTVFTNACNIVLADGVYADSEKHFVESLRVNLQLDSTTAVQIMEIITLKNLG